MVGPFATPPVHYAVAMDRLSHCVLAAVTGVYPCSITLEEAKEVHRSLKLAAGMFLHVKDHLLPKLPASPEKGVDTDSRVVEAYAHQSQAEAQEGAQALMGCRHVLLGGLKLTVLPIVTLARALELGHKPSVVSSLAAETAQLFTLAGEWHWFQCMPGAHLLYTYGAAGEALKTLDPAQFSKWSSYLQLKADFYESCVSCKPSWLCQCVD